MILPPLKVAVIGSAPYDTNKKPMGAYIDSCEVVIRFNQYVTTGHKKYVGSKTTTWCYNAATDLHGPKQSIRFIWILFRNRNSVSARIKKSTEERRARLWERIRKSAEGRKARLWEVPCGWIDDLQDELGHKWATTGLIGLHAAMRIYKRHWPIFVQGMGQLIPGKKLHYYDRQKIVEASKHDGKVEAELLEKWRAGGAIT